MPTLATIILAAGKGERMCSRFPKVLHPVAGDPLLCYPIAAAQGVGADPVICVLGHGIKEVGEVLRSRFDTPPRIICQKRQKGTADAVRVTESTLRRFTGDVLILSGDVPFIGPATLREFISYHRSGGYTLSLLTAFFENPNGYGRMVRDAQSNVLRIVEEADLGSDAERAINEVNAGIYLASRGSLFQNLHQIAKNARKKEYYLTDLIEVIVSGGGRIGGLAVADPVEVMGVNTQAHLAIANRLARQRINRSWMERGVRFTDPETTYIDRSVTLAPDVTIGVGVVLRGQTVVKSGASIDAGCILEDTVVERRARILPYSVLEGSHVGVDSQIGPFAHLRPGSEVEGEVSVGNFVELKKTTLAKGVKANHLSYLGDAVIGAGTNVGAGTITCNYDGFGKYRTVVGPRSFIGSDTQFVAPVTLGAGSWVGAGSTITKNVPAGALALSRVEQVNVRGWARRKLVKKQRRKNRNHKIRNPKS